MSRAVQQRRLDPDQRVPGEDAELHGVLDSVVDARDVLPRHPTTGHLVDELVHHTVDNFQRLDADLDLGVLPGSTRLLLVREVVLQHGLTDGLAVGHLRLADVRLDLELAAHAVHQDVQVELAHAGDDRLAGLVVLLDLEGGVLLGQLLDGDTELFLVTLGLRLDCNRDHRVREGHRLQDDLVRRVAQGLTGGGVLEADERVDVTRARLVDRVLLVGVHLEELPDALLLALGGVDHLAPVATLPE